MTIYLNINLVLVFNFFNFLKILFKILFKIKFLMIYCLDYLRGTFEI